MYVYNTMSCKCVSEVREGGLDEGVKCVITRSLQAPGEGGVDRAALPAAALLLLLLHGSAVA